MLSSLTARSDSTFVYAVQLSASTQTVPPQISLRWQPDPYGVNSYLIYRKGKEDSSWGQPIATVDGSAISWSDSNVEVGSAYEYQVIKNATVGYTGYGYIYPGIQSPVIENLGRLLLVVETNATVPLANELNRLQQDLVGDGWSVTRFGVSSNDTSESVKALIHRSLLVGSIQRQHCLSFGPRAGAAFRRNQL